MPKFICNGPIPEPGIFKYLCHADPEHLLRLADMDADLSGATEFSRVVHDIRISGVWKRTQPKRLGETERIIAGHINGRTEDVNILDVGASDVVDLLEGEDFTMFDEEPDNVISVDDD